MTSKISDHFSPIGDASEPSSTQQSPDNAQQPPEGRLEALSTSAMFYLQKPPVTELTTPITELESTNNATYLVLDCLHRR
jgi:hypothetical protein